jgi:DNA-binding Lrp family transcriptional regulator
VLTGVNEILKLLVADPSLLPGDLAKMLGWNEGEVREQLRQLAADRILLGYRAVLNEARLGNDRVRAMIEVRITPERGGGFDNIAGRSALHSELRSCHLMSGGYDLLVEVEGANLREVAGFVSERLAVLPGVLSTATHFVLQAYKEQGVLLSRGPTEERLSVSP